MPMEADGARGLSRTHCDGARPGCEAWAVSVFGFNALEQILTVAPVSIAAMPPYLTNVTQIHSIPRRTFTSRTDAETLSPSQPRSSKRPTAESRCGKQCYREARTLAH